MDFSLRSKWQGFVCHTELSQESEVSTCKAALMAFSQKPKPALSFGDCLVLCPYTPKTNPLLHQKILFFTIP